MKVALCFSGQPRFIEEGFYFINEYIIKEYSPDIFAHLWIDHDAQKLPYKFGGNGEWINQRLEIDAIEKFDHLYSPLVLKTENSKFFLRKDEYFENSAKKFWKGAIQNESEPNFKMRQINNSLSYFYSLNQVNLLQKSYSYENNFTYDVVIRLRTDSMIKSELDLSRVRENTLYFTNINKQPRKLICDWVNFGTQASMEGFTSVFSNYENIMKKTLLLNQNTWCNEALHYANLKILKIKTKGISILIELPRF